MFRISDASINLHMESFLLDLLTLKSASLLNYAHAGGLSNDIFIIRIVARLNVIVMRCLTSFCVLRYEEYITKQIFLNIFFASHYIILIFL